LEVDSTTPEPLLYTVEDVCWHTRLSRARVYQLIADGSLPSLTIGKSRRVLADDLRRWLAELATADRLQRL
jgi:excisionase family DNA binding protein